MAVSVILNGNCGCGEGNKNRLVANVYVLVFMCLRLCVMHVCGFVHVPRPFVLKKGAN